ncbi:GIY-YIG nuclease family protein [Sphaerisporangium perillae]|uniref:GIY-YIG nuclease family protein n=1 Tax=Sphaerisporangium perillae TaxID=2935860 RepID=UPI003557965E
MDAAELLEPGKLWRADEVLTRPSPIPAAPGVYGWHFDQSPDPQLPAGRLLYVGIAPRRMSTGATTPNLRTRIRDHYRGNAEGSTLRLTLGCLLGFELRRVGNGKRLTFGQAGERELTTWMAEHARVCWFVHPEPWIAESELLAQLNLPLNLDQNRHHHFHTYLSDLRASARARARGLPIAS